MTIPALTRSSLMDTVTQAFVHNLVMIARNHKAFEGFTMSSILLNMIYLTSFLFLIMTYNRTTLSSVTCDVCVVGINLL